MRKTAILIAALAGLSAGSQAQAEESATYMGIGFSGIWSNGGSVYSNTVNENVTSGGKIYGGYLSAKVGLAFTEAKHSCVSLCGTGTPSNVDTKARGLSGLIGLGVGMRMSEDLEIRVDLDHFGSVHHKVDLTKFTTGYDVMSVSLKITF